MEFGFVWWVDSSVRFKTLNVENVFQDARIHGLLFNSSPENKRNIVESTDTKTFRYLGEDSCKFRNFLVPESNSVLVYFNSISREVIRAWARCALDKHCIAPGGAKDCDVNMIDTGSCHRYENSVLGILASRLFNTDNSYSFVKDLNDIIKINKTDVLVNNCKSAICKF